MKWTWKKIVMLVLATIPALDFSFADFRHDPGPGGDVMLFLIIGFRGLSRRDPPATVITASGLLTALVLFLNHTNLSWPRYLSLSIVVGLLVIILFWGRNGTEAGGRQTNE